MKFFYQNVILPKDPNLINRIELAAESLTEKLATVRIEKLGISEYTQKYFGGYLKDIRGIIQINTYLLAWSLYGKGLSLEDIVFVDYGGGSGILTLLAKEVGVGRVIYNDIHHVAVNDSARIGKEIGNEAFAYVHGDVDTLGDYLRKSHITVDAIASYDVIEHIYNIQSFFQEIKRFPHQNLQLVFASSANLHNPVVKRVRMKWHQQSEYQDRPLEWGHKEGDSLRSYRNIRREIITRKAPLLGIEELEQLVLWTRGLIQQDIEKYLEEYLQTGNMSYRPDHPTNTCDPLTGNWKERLMDTSWIKRLLQAEGFEVEIKSGYYAFTSRKSTQLIKNILNLAITVMGAKNLNLSSYYVIYARLDRKTFL